MQKPRLLLVEQDVALHTLLIDVFQDAGYDVCAMLHDDLLAMINTCDPDVGVIGGGSRGTFESGWRTARTLRDHYPSLPLIMISTNAAAVEEVGRTERGKLFVSALHKPFANHELLNEVARWCSSSSIQA